MLRMAHRIRSEGFRFGGNLKRDDAIKLQEDIYSSETFVIDGCMETAHEKVEGVKWDSFFRDLGVLRPPFDSIFFEGAFPQGTQEKLSHRGPQQVGVLVKYIHPEMVRDGYPNFKASSEMLSTPDHSVLECNVFTTRNGTVSALDNWIYMRLDGECRFVELAASRFEHWDGAPTDLLIASLCPPMFAIALCNARNIQIVDATDRFSPDVKWLARKKQPRIVYRVLQISQANTRKSQAEETKCDATFGNARHLVRGNFATYTADKPLFGHITGTIWRPSHVRGKAENGIVLKDYAVNGGE